MTFAEARRRVAALGFTLKRDTEWQEYQVYPRGDPDHPASYHTDDLEDAVGAAEAMAGAPRWDTRPNAPVKKRAFVSARCGVYRHLGTTEEFDVEIGVTADPGGDFNFDEQPGIQLMVLAGSEEEDPAIEACLDAKEARKLCKDLQAALKEIGG